MQKVAQRTEAIRNSFGKDGFKNYCGASDGFSDAKTESFALSP
jgi:hypothetical protein